MAAATWKKVIVSGSIAELNIVSASAYYVQNNQVLATPSTTIISGSFSGSFTGALTSVLANASKPNFVAYDTTTNTFSYANTGSFTSSTASYVSSSNVYGPFGSNSIASASYASGSTSASFASTAGQILGSLTLGDGLTGSPFNGSSNITAAVGAGALITVGTDVTSVTTSSLSVNQIPKFAGGGLSGSNITDTGTQIQIGSGATSGLSVAAGGVTVTAGGLTVSAGGANVTGNSTFQNNLTVNGDLTVAGTASFTNTDNLNIRDKFILLNSGSSTLSDSGWITQYNTAGSGSSFYLEANSAGTYGRFAVAYDILGNISSSFNITADEYVNTTKLSVSNPSAAPTWGGITNGVGNMWVNTNTNDIYIWA